MGLWRLLKHKASITGVRAGNLVRLNIYFLSAIMFDIFRNLGYVWASYGSQVSGGLVFAVIGLMAASLYFCPECTTLREAWSRLKSRRSLLIYEGIVFAWVGLNLASPTLFFPFTLVMLSVATVYPTGLFLAARKRAKPSHVKNSMAMLSVTWVLFVTVGTVLFALGAQPPVLPVSLPYGWEISFMTGSVLFFLMSTTDAFTLTAVRFSSGQLIQETIVKPGHRYLILHDSGKRAISFLSSTLKGLIDSGARVVPGSLSNVRLCGCSCVGIIGGIPVIRGVLRCLVEISPAHSYVVRCRREAAHG